MRLLLVALLLVVQTPHLGCMSDASATIIRKIEYTDTPQRDAFGRLRVSNNRQLVNYTQLDDKLSLITDEELIGTGIATWDATLVGTKLETSATSDAVIRQTFDRYEYNAGRSMLIMMTIANFGAQTNVVKRFGYFHSDEADTSPFDSGYDGMFWESGESGVGVYTYFDGTQTTGSVQTAWNIDKLDGNGPSGLNWGTTEWNKLNIFWMDYQWLGAGRVRFGVVAGGEFIVVHEGGNFDNSLSAPYFAKPTNTLRWEIRQSGAGAGRMDQICATVQIEGFNSTPRKTYSGGIGDYITNLNAGTDYAIGGLRLNANKLHGTPRLYNFTMASGTNDDFLWKIMLNPTIAGTWTYNGLAGTSLEVAVASDNTNTVTGGTTLLSGNFQGGTAVTLDLAQISLPLGVSIDGTRQEVVMVATPINGTNASITGTATWAESF